MLIKPDKNEYLPLVEKYINLVPDGDITSILLNQSEVYISLLSKLNEEQANYCYEPQKWSIKTVIGHIADVERLWNYRLLRIARNDIRELPAYDRDIFAEMSSCDTLTLSQVLSDYRAVRHSSITLLENLTEEATTRVGLFNDHPLSVRAIAYIIAGHDIHHMNIIKSRYLTQLNIS